MINRINIRRKGFNIELIKFNDDMIKINNKDKIIEVGNDW